MGYHWLLQVWHSNLHLHWCILTICNLGLRWHICWDYVKCSSPVLVYCERSWRWSTVSPFRLRCWDGSNSLQDINLFSKDRTADMIAMSAIYIPILRREIRSFIETWNSHRIRKQKNRPNAIVGKPSMLYMCPPEGTRDYMQPLSHNEYERIRSETPPWDIDAVLPALTQQWCDIQLSDMGFNPHTAYMNSAAERRTQKKRMEELNWVSSKWWRLRLRCTSLQA